MNRIDRRHWIAAALLILLTAAFLLVTGRPPICACGEIKLWTGAVQSADNSQHLADWYTPSHIIHGFLFYGLGWLLFRRRPLGERIIMAVLIEAGWELLENSPVIIDRYRAATFAFGHDGDSVSIRWPTSAG